MAWFTTDDGRRVNTDWFDEDEKKKYSQIEANKQEASKRNQAQSDGGFKDGDTPKVLDKNATYKVEKISIGRGKDENYGNLQGSDVIPLLKGFHYEEMVPGDGMWYKDGVKYGFSVTRTEK